MAPVALTLANEPAPEPVTVVPETAPDEDRLPTVAEPVTVALPDSEADAAVTDVVATRALPCTVPEPVMLVPDTAPLETTEEALRAPVLVVPRVEVPVTPRVPPTV